MEIRTVELTDILEAREQRAARQRALLSRYPQTLICFTMNIAGPVKNSDQILKAWQEGLEQLRTQLRISGIPIGHEERHTAFTGNEAFLSIPADPLRVKELTVELEELHPLGRLFDMDVLRPDGAKVDRQEVNSHPRACLICGKPAAVCASRRLHSVETLQDAADKIMRRFFSEKFADRIAGLATKALLYEAAVTPKPGLVDRRSNGAHRDMDFYAFLASAAVLTPYFRDMVHAGIRSAESPAALTFQKLRFLGKAAEGAMRAATADVNTHKGAIFSIGILCGALGRLYGRKEIYDSVRILEEAAELAKTHLDALKQGKDDPSETVGSRLFREYGIAGVRGEAAAGFPSVLQFGLPVLRKSLDAGKSLDEAGYTALLYLMANTTDTNLIARSSYTSQQRLQREISDWLQAAGDISSEQAEALDREFIRRNLSPGGCADLLAVSWMLFFMEQEQLRRRS